MVAQPPPMCPLLPEMELQVEIPDGKFAGLYFSTVRALTATDLLITPPSVGPMLVPVTAGMVVVIHFKEGKLACSFATKLTPRRDPQGNPYCVCPVPAHITRVQRRRFVRVRTDAPVTFRIVKGTKTTGTQAGQLLDVSGAGARISVPFDPELAVGKRVILDFTLEAIKVGPQGRGSGGGARAGLPDLRSRPASAPPRASAGQAPTGLAGMVGEVIKCDLKPEGRQEFAVKFTGLTETDRQQLIRFVFQQQLQQKRKG